MKKKNTPPGLLPRAPRRGPRGPAPDGGHCQRQRRGRRKRRDERRRQVFFFFCRRRRRPRQARRGVPAAGPLWGARPARGPAQRQGGRLFVRTSGQGCFCPGTGVRGARAAPGRARHRRRSETLAQRQGRGGQEGERCGFSFSFFVEASVLFCCSGCCCSIPRWCCIGASGGAVASRVSL